MKKTRIVLTAAGLLLLSTIFVLAVCQNEGLRRQGNLTVLGLEGGAYERGLQHGKALKKEILELVGRWKSDIRESYRTDPDVFIRDFLAATSFQTAAKKWTPDLMVEIRGIAKGAGLDFDTAFAFQLVDEMWVLGKEVQAEKCTTVGVAKTGPNPSVVAQNLDIPSFYHGFQTLLHIKEPERNLETFLFTFPGFIAANGLNNHSVAVVVNAVQQLASSRDGLPVAFVIRGILQSKTYDEAVRFINKIQHGAPQNYLIGGPEDVGSYECSTTHVDLFVPFEGARFTYHTNHPLRNLNYSPRFLEYFEAKNISPEDYEHSCPRFRALEGLLRDNTVSVDVPMLKDIFRGRETGINNRGTFGCTLMILGESPELHISPGRPDEEPFQIFRFEED